MSIILKKYCIAFLFSLFLFLINTNAQVTYSDTLIHSQGNEDEKTTEFQKEDYFLNKNVLRDEDDSLHLRQLPAAEIKKLQDDDAFWYANANIKKQIRSEKESLTSQTWFRTLLWLMIIGGFAAFIMIYLANSDIGLFSRRNRPIKNATEEEVESEDIFAINYQREIDKAIKNKNYRLAVRLLFLRSLRKLADKNIIQYKQGRTNFDYLLQLSPTNYYKDFFRITRNYEYSWYGQFDVNPETFDVIRKDVENFENNLR